MKTRWAFGMILASGLLLGFASAGAAGDLHPFVKLGLDMNGNYDTPYGFTDRFLYQFGLDVPVTGMIGVGGEFDYQKKSGEETELGVTVKDSASLYQFFGNVVIAPDNDNQIKPYGFAGFGAAHVTFEIKHADEVELSGSVTKAALQAGAGLMISHFLADVKIVHIFAEDYETDVYASIGFRF